MLNFQKNTIQVKLFVDFSGPMPEYYRKKPWYERPKGVSNRVAGLDWIYNYTKSIGDTSGVLYFADDDNTYDIRLFEEVISSIILEMCII